MLSRKSCKTIGTVLVLTSVKVAPNFLAIFAVFLNDLWYYKYHHKSNPRYPNTTLAFTEKVELVKQFQLSPDELLAYLPFTKEASNTS